MPYTTEWEQHGVYWRYWGTVSGKELIDSNLDIYGDERFDAMKYQIVDFLQIDAFQVTRDDMLKIAAYDRAAALSNPRVKVAVVAKITAIKFLTALYDAENIKSPWETRMFDSVEQARSWVDTGKAIVYAAAVVADHRLPVFAPCRTNPCKNAPLICLSPAHAGAVLGPTVGSTSVERLLLKLGKVLIETAFD